MLSDNVKKYLDETKEFFKIQRIAGKKHLKYAIDEWLKEQDVTAFVSFEGYDLYPHRNYLRVGAVRLNNGVGSVSKKNNWLNKVIVEHDIRESWRDNKEIDRGWKVRTHKITTDAKMLSPFDQTFLHFVEEMSEYLKQ